MANTIDDFNKKRLRSSNITVTISISLVLFLVGLFGLILINAQKYSDYIKEQLVVEVYFQEYLDPRDAKKVDAYHQETYQEVLKQPYVKKARFITKEEASKIGRKQLGINTEALFEEHIFPPSIEVTLFPDYIAPDKIEGVIKQLGEIKGVLEVKNDSKFTQEVYYNLNRILLWIVGFASLFLVIAIILINSSIRLKIFSKRFIIKTMQLVGARRRFILKPFIKEAVIIGVIGAFIGLVLLSIVWYYFTKEIGDAFVQDTGKFMWLILLVVGVGIAITVLSTIFATWRFLKSNMDDLYYS
ncbi:MAG: permease-like cell division protein FtsX [Flavobacteriaceae bacterium]|nr:permease-like cell division protein FtsX [Flavobacteriaceae bacterium]